jgi:hypothetical protein
MASSLKTLPTHCQSQENKAVGITIGYIRRINAVDSSTINTFTSIRLMDY